MAYKSSRQKALRAAPMPQDLRSGRQKVAKAVGNVATSVKKVASTKGGKAGMALAGLAAAGGLGMAGMKAIGARKKKANSLQGRLSSAINKNAGLKKAGTGLSKTLTKMGIKN